MWLPISTAPFDRDLELAVVDSNGVRAIAFRCRRVLGAWIKAEIKARLDVCPTYWPSGLGAKRAQFFVHSPARVLHSAGARRGRTEAEHAGARPGRRVVWR